MENKETLEQIKANKIKCFKARDNYNNEIYRCAVEETGSVFVYAPNKKRRGWRYNEENFLTHFIILPLADENQQWKKRLNRAVKLCKTSGLWSEIAVIWENLYKYVSLDEKRKIHDMSWDDRDGAVAYCKEHYPFMINTSEGGHEYLNTDYIWELSRCELKTMYFGYANAIEKKEIRKAISERRQYTIPCIRTNYDVSFSYNPDANKAWYSEEYKNCGNGHYYLALNHSIAVFCETD